MFNPDSKSNNKTEIKKLTIEQKIEILKIIYDKKDFYEMSLNNFKFKYETLLNIFTNIITNKKED